MTLLAVTSADLAAWVDAIGTWVVGLALAAITVLQYRHSRFRPKVRAYRDLRHRIVVRVTNEGAGAGTVEDVDLVNNHDPSSHVVPYTWELPGGQEDESTRTPLPFALPGLSTASWSSSRSGRPTSPKPPAPTSSTATTRTPAASSSRECGGPSSVAHPYPAPLRKPAGRLWRELSGRRCRLARPKGRGSARSIGSPRGSDPYLLIVQTTRKPSQSSLRCITSSQANGIGDAKSSDAASGFARCRFWQISGKTPLDVRAGTRCCTDRDRISPRHPSGHQP